MFKFLLRYSDEEREAVTETSSEWPDAVASMVELEKRIPLWSEVKDTEQYLAWMNQVRVLFESLYVAGYNKGISDATRTKHLL